MRYLVVIRLAIAVGVAVRLVVLWLMLIMIRFVVVDLRMMSVAYLLNHSVKSVMFVCGVLNDAFCAICFIQAVFAFHNVAVSNFPLTFVVASVSIFDAVLEFVLGIRVVILVVIRSISRGMAPAVLYWNSVGVHNRLVRNEERLLVVMIIVSHDAVLSANVARR